LDRYGENVFNFKNQFIELKERIESLDGNKKDLKEKKLFKQIYEEV
jgi:hypothetical protein